MTELEILIEAYVSGAVLLQDSLQNLDSSSVDLRPIPNKWAIREVVCHLTDSEIIYADRFKRVLAEDNPTFFEADPVKFCTSLCVGSRRIEDELDVIASVRKHMASILKSIDESSFNRLGQHSLDGPMTLRVLVQRITNHISHHIRFIDEKRERMSC
ncbi:MAG: DinB family protein [Planctomycetales bacterium]|nr:DinB family protein [Planctomycetales bacterium]